MNTDKKRFIELCMRAGALLFGEYELKSGRVSPYFFNAGAFNRGALLNDAAEHYARVIDECVGGEVMLFGPAYKGIPLAAATAVALSARGVDAGYAFNRKEIKDHGEGGGVVGAPLAGRVVIVDDVITAGASVGEAVAIIRAAGATPAAVVVALDREERAGEERLSAAQSVARAHDVPVHAIVSLADLVAFLENDGDADAIKAYRKRYGVGDVERSA